MNFNKGLLTKLRYSLCIMAVTLSTYLYSCDSGTGNSGNSSTNGNQTDINNESDASTNGNDDPADTLTIGGSSDGQPTGATPIQDSVATPSMRIDSLQNSQSGTNSTNNGDNANKNGNNSNNGNSNRVNDKQKGQGNNSSSGNSNIETSSDKKSDNQ
ncbi:hypothetical protein GXP67_24640 [Rhodocytophaga rosea]|uniref:Uncharacterized protein n=1 Tax=Rhodocytophaga rosea TaxID=2704465 RepID=A0A6C0GNU8_9BACT|nr:hypothetical protein [Rhodocytophaga rosea]QHT69607.1 hypothetical protein GXP67_24640 [Rhodocytophaga rosea]